MLAEIEMHHIYEWCSLPAYPSLVSRQQKMSDFRGLRMRLDICMLTEVERYRIQGIAQVYLAQVLILAC